MLQSKNDIQNLLLQAGFANELLSSGNKYRAIQDILVHQVFKYRRDEIDGLQKGMESLQLTKFLNAAQGCITLVFPLEADVIVTVDDIAKAIKPDDPQNMTKHQQEVVDWFMQYIKYIGEGKQLLFKMCKGCVTYSNMI